MESPLLSALFSFTGVTYGFILPLLLVLTLTLLFMASMTSPGAKPQLVAKALYCYLLEALGILLMTAGAIPTIVSVLAGVGLAGSTYFTLLITFAAGGVIFLTHDSMVRQVEKASRLVPEVIFFTAFRMIGQIAVIVWALSFVITLFGFEKEPGWWVMPIVMVAYGWLFVWATSEDKEAASPKGVFKTMTMVTGSKTKMATAKVAMPKAKKTKAKRKSKKK